jgi:hypothetical protein
MSEYSGQLVGSSPCSYASLANYNYNAPTQDTLRNPPVPPTLVQGQYIVPTFGGIPGYNTLVKGGNSCSGYADINSAYGAGAGSCSPSYVSKLCGQ